MKLPLASRSKVPLHDSFERITDDPLKVRAWEEAGFNTGMLLGGLSALDFDEIEAARRFAQAHPELLVLVNRTYRAVHILFQGETKQRAITENGKKVGDIKSGEHSYIVVPPSKVWNKEDRILHEYKWIRGSEPSALPRFPEELFPITEKKAITRKEVKNAVAYISKIQAIQGKGGSNATFRAACVLRDNEMDEASALAAMVEWNKTNAIPPWEVCDLLKKVRDAFSVVLKGER